MLYTPSLIQTILSVPELHRFLRLLAARRLYCRWGIAPRPEDSLFGCSLVTVYTMAGHIATIFFSGCGFVQCAVQQAMWEKKMPQGGPG